MPHHPFCEEIPPDVQPKPTLAQLKTESSCPILQLFEKISYFLLQVVPLFCNPNEMLVNAMFITDLVQF